MLIGGSFEVDKHLLQLLTDNEVSEVVFEKLLHEMKGDIFKKVMIDQHESEYNDSMVFTGEFVALNLNEYNELKEYKEIYYETGGGM